MRKGQYKVTSVTNQKQIYTKRAQFEPLGIPTVLMPIRIKILARRNERASQMF